MKITFTIPGEAKGKGRPRFSRTQNGGVKTRTPEDTAVYENLVKIEYRSQCGRQRFADDATLFMQITAYFSIPKSTSKKRKTAMLAGEIRPAKRPDPDNICKLICDALNQIAYRDDAQIVEIEIRKHYSDIARVVVSIQDQEESNGKEQ